MEATAEKKNKVTLAEMFRALQYRNYRLFFMGQGVSLIGTWMQQVAMSWLVYRLTNSVLLLGILGFAGQVPAFLLGPFAGVLSDRFNKHRILILTQSLAMLQATILAVLVLTNAVTIYWILALSIFLGIVNAFDTPTRQSFVINLIDKREDVSNAIALNSSLFNVARLAGPSIAGLVIAAVGEGMCFALNALSYIAVLFSLLSLRVQLKPSTKKDIRVWESLREGFKYVVGFPPIRAILLQIGLISLFGMPFSVLMPVFARDILHGGANTLGYLMGASGIGALTGALYLAKRPSVLGLGKVIITATLMLSFGLICFSFTRHIGFALVFITITGFGMIVQMAANNTILQTIVEDDKRGRVMSFYSMAFLGMAPFGSLLAGTLANRIGVPYTLLICGCLCSLIVIPFAIQLPKMRRLVRPIYQQLGILPQVATGVQTASNLTMAPEQR
ncbi:MFS transporter [Adhaeribacter radiodurans]|uniref:MFS transporter n=1 Tax=Adhaeribacter radiodurans TaxID=2745197 RepID=A0A7L7L4E6_9BACT|nr:MFS transporter [Adhaeribacter radiodurans]QMU27650.1 MFS transporter [Adhaeribacter radiodurans]